MSRYDLILGKDPPGPPKPKHDYWKEISVWIQGIKIPKFSNIFPVWIPLFLRGYIIVKNQENKFKAKKLDIFGWEGIDRRGTTTWSHSQETCIVDSYEEALKVINRYKLYKKDLKFSSRIARKEKRRKENFHFVFK